MVLKKVLGFATTTSLILLVIVAPTTTTASLQQQEGNATIDEPNIPIGPADEDEEPGDNITDNENNDTGDIGEPPIAKEPIGPANETGDAHNATTTTGVVCPDVLETRFQTDKKTYTMGEDVTVSGHSTAGGRITGNESTPVELRFLNPGTGGYTIRVQPKYSDCSFSFTYVLKDIWQVGTWEVSAVYPPGDQGGQVIGKTQFEVVPAEEAGCEGPPVRDIGAGTTTQNVGDDVIVSGLFSPPPRDRGNSNTPVEVTYKGPQDASYRSVEVQPKYGTFSYDDDCGYLEFEFVIKNVQQVGLWDVFAVYPPLNVHLYTQFGVYSGQERPLCEDIGSPGNGHADDDYCIDDDHTPHGPIDTWIFWITAPEEEGRRYIQYGGSIKSSAVDLTFEAYASGDPVSHVLLKIDGGKYERVAMRYDNYSGYSYGDHAIGGLPVGPHRIYAKAVDQDGNEDPTPTSWKFTVIGGYLDTWTYSVKEPNGRKIPNGGTTASTTVIVDCKGTVYGRGWNIELKLDNGPHERFASCQHIFPGLSLSTHTISFRMVNQDGTTHDLTPAKFTFTVKGKGGGNPETWINWVKGKSLDGGSYVKIRDGAVTTSHRFIVDFQSTATDTGKGSYVQFNIDKGPWKHVASPYKFSIPSCGKHTIYLQGVDKYGNKDPTPAKFSFTIDNDNIVCAVSTDSDEEDPCAAFCGRGACAEIGPENDTDGSPPSPPPPSPPPENDTGGAYTTTGRRSADRVR
jgi:hypothetical protein